MRGHRACLPVLGEASNLLGRLKLVMTLPAATAGALGEASNLLGRLKQRAVHAAAG